MLPRRYPKRVAGRCTVGNKVRAQRTTGHRSAVTEVECGMSGSGMCSGKPDGLCRFWA